MKTVKEKRSLALKILNNHFKHESRTIHLEDHQISLVLNAMLEYKNQPPHPSPKLKEMLDEEYPMNPPGMPNFKGYFTDKVADIRKVATKYFLAGQQSIPSHKISDEEIDIVAKSDTIQRDGQFFFKRGAKWMRDNYRPYAQQQEIDWSALEKDFDQWNVSYKEGELPNADHAFIWFKQNFHHFFKQRPEFSRPTQTAIDWKAIDKEFDDFVFKGFNNEMPKGATVYSWFKDHPKFKSHPTGEQINYKERYEKIANSEWFKRAYGNKTLGEVAALHESGEQKLPVGTKIKFIKDLDCEATGDHPAYQYAKEGMTGEITGHDAPEGYMVKTDNWPHPFGAEINTEFVEFREKDKELAVDWIGSDNSEKLIEYEAEQLILLLQYKDGDNLVLCGVHTEEGFENLETGDIVENVVGFYPINLFLTQKQNL